MYNFILKHLYFSVISADEWHFKNCFPEVIVFQCKISPGYRCVTLLIKYQ